MQYINYLQSVQLNQPAWLYVYTILAIVVLVYQNISISNLLQGIHFKHSYKHTYYKTIENIIRCQQTPSRIKNTAFRKILHLMTSGLIFLSLAEPYINGTKLPTPPNNRDIIFVVDNAVSMVLKDYLIDNQRVERLTMVKSVLLNFTNKLSGNRLGIVTFSEEAHTLVPLTTDSRLIRKMIPRIESTLTGRTSNPQNALLYTLNYINNLKIGKPDTVKPAIVLITDILRPPRDIDPVVVARYIGEKGYKLYIVAIGTSTYKKSDVDSSSLIYHPASFKRLKEMAKSAKGDFYHAKNTASLNNIIRDILKTKKSRLAVKPEYIQTPLFQWPLLLALLLVIIEYISSLVSFRSSHA